MMTVIVEGVPATMIGHVWSQCWPFLENAIKRFPGVTKPYTETGLIHDLTFWKKQLWIVFDPEISKVVAAIISDVMTDERHPGRKFLEVPLVGGERFKEWRDPMWKLLKDWGISQGCTDMVGYGRQGWKRVYGFHEFEVNSDGIPVMYRPLKEN